MTFVKIDAEAEAVLKQLHEKYRLGVISNFAIPECVHKLLRNACIDHLFDIVVVSGAVNKRKPAAEIFKSTLKIMNLSAQEAVFVGDTIDADVEGAKAVGMKSVYIERRPQKLSDKYVADRTIRKLSELPAALEGFRDY
jgi:putative hydrolase of the HAD superfamily